MTARIDAAEMDGFLAYADGDVVGWLNAQPWHEAAALPARGSASRRPSWTCAAHQAAVIVCFVIAPPWRRRGVARALLDGRARLVRRARHSQSSTRFRSSAGDSTTRDRPLPRPAVAVLARPGSTVARASSTDLTVMRKRPRRPALRSRGHAAALPLRRARRRSLLPHFLASLYGLAIVYASLQPFAPWIAPAPGTPFFLFAPWPPRWTRFDVDRQRRRLRAVRILRRADAAPAAAARPAVGRRSPPAAALSFAMETLQMFLPPRDASVDRSHRQHRRRRRSAALARRSRSRARPRAKRGVIVAARALVPAADASAISASRCSRSGSSCR